MLDNICKQKTKLMKKNLLIEITKKNMINIINSRIKQTKP